MGGWAIIVADIIVMANLAQIAGIYSFKLFDWTSAADSTFAVTLVGVLWIVVMTAICYIGIELSARTQQFLLGAELITLTLFAVVALFRVYAYSPRHSIDPSLSWLNPFDVSSFSALADGMLLGVFIYWGWDSGVTVNEETEDASTAPGRAAVISTLVLLAIYAIVSIAAQAYAGPNALAKNADDIFSGGLAHGRPRLAAGQAADHRGAHLGVGVDADDDPADGADEPVDGAAEGLPRGLRPDPSALPLAERVHPDDGGAVDRLVRRDRQPQHQRAVRLDHRDRLLDRLLLRASRASRARSTTGASCSRARRTSSSPGCSR